MAKGPETRIQKNIQDALKKEYPNSFFYKTHGGPYQQSGIPDLVGVIHGIFIAIEVKTPDKKDNTTKLQDECLRKISKAEGLAFVSWSPEHALDYIHDHFENRF